MQLLVPSPVILSPQNQLRSCEKPIFSGEGNNISTVQTVFRENPVPDPSRVEDIQPSEGLCGSSHGTEEQHSGSDQLRIIGEKIAIVLSHLSVGIFIIWQQQQQRGSMTITGTYKKKVWH